VTLELKGLNFLIKEHPKRIRAWLEELSADTVQDIIASFNSGPPGRVYVRPGGRTHTASSPGYPPNVDTGAYKRSLRHKMVSDLVAEIHDGMEYGIYLELGTTHIGGRMAARPHVTPAIERLRRGAALKHAHRFGLFKVLP
jgi:hypothetical protein